MANHQQILSETVYRSFEVPLLHDLDRWRGVIEDEELTYQHKIRAQTREVKRLEKEGLQLHRQPRRDVARFRAHLVHLTDKLDGLTTLHADHARALLRESQDMSVRIVDASCSLVRAEVDIFESLARKGWAGGGLDDLLDRGRDLFAADDAAAAKPADPAKLFSILPPKSILADSASDPARPDHDALVPSDLHLFAPGSASSAGTAGASTSATVVPSDPAMRPPPRPFSPQPIRRVPTDVTFDTLGALAFPAPAPPRLDLRDAWAKAALADEGEERADERAAQAADEGPGADSRQLPEAFEADAQHHRGRTAWQLPSRRSTSALADGLAAESS